MSYDQQLRVIGQSLESKRISVFELKNHGDWYMVHGAPEKNTSLIARFRQWTEKIRGQSLGSHHSYTLADLQRFEREGKLQRIKANRLPDFYSLSNMLRTVGSYLERKNGELLEIHKRPLSLTILYQNRNGHPDLEERSIASFYNLFIELYGKRGRSN
ncbi:MAG TPA: hypothetical protein VE689_06680 [Candidatus Udaeobacter sp.]|nr:hypothetical protein [Candidatus Udaeobacter sp.]